MNTMTPMICLVGITCHLAYIISEIHTYGVVLAGWEEVAFFVGIFPAPLAVLGIMGFLGQKDRLPLFIVSLILTSLWVYHISSHFIKRTDAQGGMGLVVLGISQWGIVLLFLIAMALRKVLRRTAKTDAR